MCNLKKILCHIFNENIPNIDMKKKVVGKI